MAMDAGDLEAMIKELQGQVLSLRQDLTQTDDNNVRAGLGNTNAAVHSLQDGRTNTNIVVDGIKKDFGRTKVNA